MNYSTLIELLLSRKTVDGDKGITFINGSNLEEFLSYGELYRLSLSVLSELQQKGIRPKDELIVQLSDNKSFVIVFWACVLGGIIPVPLSTGQKDEHKRKFFNVWETLNNPFLITEKNQYSSLSLFAEKNNTSATFSVVGKQTILINELTINGVSSGVIAEVKPDDIAFIQFSSGSTGSPKGVMLTHLNLLTNVNSIALAADYSRDDSTLSWMPLTHDMGMIGFHINPLFSGMNQYIIPTDLFIRRPGLWLEKATEYKTTILCSPNFGYNYVLKHTSDKQSGQLNLSSVRIIYNGAEPISLKIATDFITQMSDNGLNSRVMRPVYGLAEASLAVSISKLNDPIEWVTVDRQFLKPGDRVKESSGSDNSISFVNVGKEIPDCTIRIVDSTNEILPEMAVGHILIQGLNVTGGYYNNEEESKKSISPDGWLNTGDLGFLKDGCLYVTGRAKEIIFVNGQNFYPQDIESILCELPEVELNKVIVCGTTNELSEREEVIIFVFHRGVLEKFLPLITDIRDKIGESFGIKADRVIPVKEIPRTTSGKLQRLKLLQEYKSGVFEEVELQIQKLLLESTLADNKDVYIPVTESEVAVFEIWKKVLNRSEFSRQTDFFKAGGNSLKAAELAMEVYMKFGHELALADLYHNRTIEAQALLLESIKGGHFKNIDKQPQQPSYPLSYRQKSLYYLWRLNPETLSYNIPFGCKIPRDISLEVIEQAVRTMVKNHDVYRTAFVYDNEPAFIVRDEYAFSLPVIKAEQSEITTVFKQLEQPFDLAEGKLLHCTLIDTGKESNYLFFDFHHIISDGTSTQLFIQELFELIQGKVSPVRTIDYKDFVVWERQQLETENLLQQADWWHNKLKDLPSPLNLPTNFVRPLLVDYKGRKQSFKLDEVTVEKIKKLVNERQCTLHTFFFSVYKLLLYKYSGQQDLLIGVPVSGRRHPDLRYLQGMFVNVLCLRNTIKETDSFDDFLRSEQRNLIDSLDNQDYPFELLLEQLDLKRDQGRNPLFDTMFVYQHADLKQKIGSIDIEQIQLDSSISKYDLSLEVIEGTDSISYQFEYATSLFSDERISQFNRHFKQLLDLILHQPQRIVGEISPLSLSEWDDSILNFNKTSHNIPLVPSIVDLIKEQARIQPDAIAIKDGESTLTYQDIEVRIQLISEQLRKSGVETNDKVGVYMERSAEFVLSILGILNAGGTYVPIDSHLPSSRISYIINHCDARYVLADESCVDRINESDFDKDVNILLFSELNNRSQVIEKTQFRQADLAYILYTSGTTGLPKGVMIPQTALINYICSCAELYVSNNKTNFAFHTSVSFDLTVTSLFTPLITGGTVVVYKEDNNGLIINTIINDNLVDTIKLTPSHLNLLLRSTSKIDATRNNLKRIIVGGEKLDIEVVLGISELFSGKIDIYNEYGPTEATVGCMIYKCTGIEAGSSIPIGKPFYNTQIYVLDSFLNPLPIGVKGELYISGVCLAKGYLKDDNQTQNRFITNPFIEGELMYKSGDLAYFDSKNEIVYVGRIDEQLKINGYRIEPEEIRHHLLTNESILDAVVVPSFSKKNTQIIAAYVVGNTEEKLDTDALIDFLAERVPYYMIPAFIQQIETIPLTLNGKIDVTKLNELGREDNKVELVLSEVENTMLEIWQNVMEEKIIGVHDNYFDLGGDSIKAVQIVSRMAEQGLSVKVKDIMIYQTVNRICQHLETHPKVVYEQGYLNGCFNPFPIHKWLFSRHFNKVDFYNQSVLLELHADIDIEKLNNAFTSLINHHDTLRLNYNAESGQLFYNSEHIDTLFSVKQFDIIEESQLAHIYTELGSQFDLTKSLLINAAVIYLNDEQNYLFIYAHHLVVDGISWRILLDDLNQLYSYEIKGVPLQLKPKTASLIDWENGLQSISEKSACADEISYWNQIKNSKCCFPQDVELHDWFMADSSKSNFKLDKTTTDILMKSVYKKYSADFQSLLLAALSLTLKEWVTADHFVIELENHGRHINDVDVSRTVGWFTVMHPFKLNLDSDYLEDAITTVHDGLLEIPDHGLGYGLFFQPDDMAEIRFNYLGVFGQELANDLFSYVENEKAINSDKSNRMTAKLEWNCMIVNGELSVEIMYNSKAFKHATIESLLKCYSTNLNQFVAVFMDQESDFSALQFGVSETDQQEFDDLFL